MKVEIKSIKVFSKYVERTNTEFPDQREVGTKVMDQYRTDVTFVLPAIEVDGLIVVGGIYELMFARRES